MDQHQVVTTMVMVVTCFVFLFVLFYAQNKYVACISTVKRVDVDVYNILNVNIVDVDMIPLLRYNTQIGHNNSQMMHASSSFLLLLLLE